MQMKGKQFENSYALALGQHSIHANPYSLKILQIERKMERGKNIQQNVEKNCYIHSIVLFRMMKVRTKTRDTKRCMYNLP